MYPKAEPHRLAARATSVTAGILGAVAKNLPPKTPGDANISVSDDAGNFTLPVQLHQDAVVFYAVALKYDAVGGPHAAGAVRRYVRASVIAAFSALEARLNQAAFGHTVAHRQVLDAFVVDVLREYETAVDEQGHVYQRKRRMSLTTRLSFLTAFLSGQEFDRRTKLWRDLLDAVNLRDNYVHPKPPFSWDYAPAQAKDVIDTVTAVLVEMSRLMDLEPMSWDGPVEDLVAARDPNWFDSISRRHLS